MNQSSSIRGIRTSWNLRSRYVIRALRVAACAVAALLAAPTTVAAEPHVLRFADALDITTIDPLDPRVAANAQLDYLTAAYLVRYSSRGLVPEYATVVPSRQNGGISRDGRTIVFHLRRDARWSDGAALTSADVAFTLAYLRDPKTITQFRDGTQFFDRVETPDARTVTFRLKRPFLSALDFFGSRNAPLVPEHILAKGDPRAFAALPIGAGPFRYVRWSRGDRVVLERNPYYALGKAKLRRIEYVMDQSITSAVTGMRTGRIDLMPTQSNATYRQIQGVDGITARAEPAVRATLIAFNTRDVSLSEQAVRRALRSALDRTGLLRRVFSGAGSLAETPIPTDDPFAASLPIEPYDPQRARAILDAAGWKVGPDGFRARGGRRLAVTLVAPSGAIAGDETVELVRANWTAVGVEVTTKRYPASFLFAPASQGGVLEGGSFGAAFFGLGELRARDLDLYLPCRLAPPNGANYFRFCDARVDRLLARASSAYEESKTRSSFFGVQRIVTDAVPFIVVARLDQYDIARDSVVGAVRGSLAYFFDPLTIDVAR